MGWCTPRELLFDQMRSVLTRDDGLAGGGLVTNLELARFARHYGGRVKFCRPYRVQTKGKVERPIRYLRESLLTSNKGFEDWGEIFGDEVMAAALIDRLLHHCHIVNIRGNSYRLREHAELRSALRQHPTPPPAKLRRKEETAP